MCAQIMSATERYVPDNSGWSGRVANALPPSGGRGNPGRPAMAGFGNFGKTLYSLTKSGPPQHKDPRHPDQPGSVRLITRTVLWIVVGRGGCAGTPAASGGPRGAPMQGFGNFGNSLYSHGQNRLQNRGNIDFPPGNILTSDLYMFRAADYQFSGVVVRARNG